MNRQIGNQGKSGSKLTIEAPFLNKNKFAFLSNNLLKNR